MRDNNKYNNYNKKIYTAIIMGIFQLFLNSGANYFIEIPFQFDALIGMGLSVAFWVC